MVTKLLSGVMFNILNVIIQVFVGLFVFRILLSYMGEADFGFWAVLLAFLSQIALFELGLGMILSRHVSSLECTKLERKRVVTNILTIMFFVAWLFVFSTLLLTELLAQFGLDINVTTGESTFLIIFFLSSSYALNYVAGGFQGYISAKFHFKTLNTIKISTNILRFFLLLLVADFDLGIVGVSVIFFISALVDVLAKYLACRAFGLNEDLDMAALSKEKIIDLFRSGIKFLPMKGNDYIRNNFAIVLVGGLLGGVNAVPLRISGRLMEIYTELSVTLNYVLTPYFSRVSTSSNDDFVKHVLMGLFASSLLSSLIFLNIWLLGDWFLAFWLGDVPDNTGTILLLLAIGFSVVNMQGASVSLLIAKGFYDVNAKLCLSELILTLISMPIFAYFYGAVGAALSLTFSLTIVRGLIQPVVISKLLGVKLSSYARALILGALGPLVMVGVCELASSFLTSEELTYVLLLIFFQLSFIALAFFYLRFSKKLI